MTFADLSVTPATIISAFELANIVFFGCYFHYKAIKCFYFSCTKGYSNRCRSRQNFGWRKCLVPEKFSGKSCANVSTPSFGMTSKERSSCDSAYLGCQFFKIKRRWAPFLPVFKLFARIFRYFPNIFMDFAQIFTDFA